MNRSPDVDLVLDDYFADDGFIAPDHVLDVVEERIAGQPQRRVWRVPWRDSHVNSSFKPLLAVAAVVLIAVVGYSVLQREQGAGGPSTATPTSTIAPSSPGPSLSTCAYDWPTMLTSCTYTTRFIWDIPFELQFSVPDGWQSRDVEVIRGQTLSVAFNLAGNTFSDPCDRVPTEPPTGPTVDDLAAALAALPGFDATAATRVSATGVADGRYIELAVREDVGCSTPGLWADPPNSYNGEGPIGPPVWAVEESNMRMWILDIDGVRLVVSALSSDAATPADLNELQAVVDSVRIVPATGPPFPVPSPE